MLYTGIVFGLFFDPESEAEAEAEADIFLRVVR
jgi:hypothetical protein